MRKKQKHITTIIFESISLDQSGVFCIEIYVLCDFWITPVRNEKKLGLKKDIQVLTRATRIILGIKLLTGLPEAMDSESLKLTCNLSTE